MLVVMLLLTSPALALDVINGGAAPQVGHQRVYAAAQVPVFRYEILQTYPHDTDDYTEALFMHDGRLYEGTGRYGHSRLKIWDLDSGEILRQRKIPDRYFGEGAVVTAGKLFHLTYISNSGFIYAPETLEPLARFSYRTQGWGLTTDGRHLIMSDGSAGIAFLDPDSLATDRYLIVRDAYGPVGFLNELEYVEGEIYANVWQTDYIVRFSAETGKVTGWLDLTGLNPDPASLVYPKVLNGIAYTGEPGTLVVTGKQWPHLWHIRLVPADRN